MPTTPDEPRGGPELCTVDGRSLPLVSATLRVKAGGGLARVVLEQTFENPYDDTLRVTYKMPLPALGAVSGYAFRIGARTITGKVDRKESARARFEEAIASGRTAALLEQNKADIFTQEIGNIAPRSTIVAEITVDQRLAWTREGEWELRFPTVIGPRFIGAHVSKEDAQASHIELAPGGVRARVHLEVTIDDAITDGRLAESPSHRLATANDGVVTLLDAAGGKLDRDIVVRWPVAARSVGLSVQTARPESASPNARHAFALLSIVPPAPDAGHAAVPRDLIVLLDTSGSMGGPPLEQAKRVVASLIDSLTEQDRLEVTEFSSRANRYTRQPVAGTPREKEKAIAWVMARQASGGTEMQSAIVDALRGLRAGAQRQVVLVTDGYVGGEEQIVTLLHESLPPSCRMHVVGVGAAVNRNLAASLARAGRGAEVLVGLDEDAERSSSRLLDKTRLPVLTDLVISGDALIEQAPEHVPDVFAGSPVLAALQIRAAGGEIVVRGSLARGTWEQRIVVPAVDAGAGNPSVMKLFARERVADLEMRWSIGKEVAMIDREIESLGLVFQIATRRTSWLAIDDDRSVDPRIGSRHEEIPQEVPYGTTLSSFGGPMMLAAPMGAMSMSTPPMMFGGGMAPARPRSSGMMRNLPAPSPPPRASGAMPPPAQASFGEASKKTLTGGGDDAREDFDDDITGRAVTPFEPASSVMASAPAPLAVPAEADADAAAKDAAPVLARSTASFTTEGRFAPAPAPAPAPGRPSASRWFALLLALVLLALALAATIAWLLFR